MEGSRLIRSIRLDHILSYGAPGANLELEPLNVFIGANASGKSNLIEALSLLAAAPKDLQAPIREGGGVADWLWKGGSGSSEATIEAIVDNPDGQMPFRYRISFTEVGGRFSLLDEAIENERPYMGKNDPYFYYAFQNGHPFLNVRTTPEVDGTRTERRLRREDVSPEQSILSQRRDPDTYPELTYLASIFERMAFYRESNLGRHTPPRLPQKADLPEGRLFEDGGNLGLVLNSLLNRPPIREEILGRLLGFYERITELTTQVQGGTVQIFFHEKGLKHPVPATRFSDGTLRFLCLLAILCHPEPPPVVCLEEPELGLHPDAIPTIAEMLVQAASRTQLFVTTHSDALIDALSDYPETVVVCERGEGGSELRRLNKEQLSEWLERYRLGELWKMGELGGNPP